MPKDCGKHSNLTEFDKELMEPTIADAERQRGGSVRRRPDNGLCSQVDPFGLPIIEKDVMKSLEEEGGGESFVREPTG